MNEINFTSKKTGNTLATIKLPNCIATPMTIVGLSAGLGVVVGFGIGLVEDVAELIKKLRNK